MLDLLGLIPLLPLVGVAVNGLFGRRMSLKAVGFVACGVVFVSFALSAGAVIELAGLPEDARAHAVSFGTWMPLEGLAPLNWSFAIDPLTSVMILVVTTPCWPS